MKLEYLKVGPMDVNCAVAVCPETQDAFVVDPGGNFDEIVAVIEKLKARVKLILITHSHFDHVLAARQLKEYTGAKVYLPRKDKFLWRLMGIQFKMCGVEDKPVAIDHYMKDGDVITVGTLSLKVIHSPGHSPGGCLLYMEDESLLFAGDTIFRESIGNCQIPFANLENLFDSIFTKVMVLPDDTRVIPGHNDETTIGHEREHNPLLKPDQMAIMLKEDKERPGTMKMMGQLIWSLVTGGGKSEEPENSKAEKD